MPNPRLENFGLTTNSDPSLAPEYHAQRLQGNVYGHPDFADGERITTSAILSIDYVNRTAECRSRIYDLGKPDPKYVQLIREQQSTMAPECAAFYAQFDPAAAA